MSCPVCRTTLLFEEGEDDSYCPICNQVYFPHFNFKGVEVRGMGCLDNNRNIFCLYAGDTQFIVKQPMPSDLEGLMEGMSKASEYTFLRYPSMFWEHPQGICNVPFFHPADSGILYLIMVIGETVVGMSHHTYWVLDEETKQEENLPIPVGNNICIAQLCVFDPYQNQGIGSLYALLSEYIAQHFDADFIMGETHGKKGMVNIRLKTGWSVLSRRMVSKVDERVLIGKPLYPIS